MLNINGDINEGTIETSKRKRKKGERGGEGQRERGNLRIINLQRHGLKYSVNLYFNYSYSVFTIRLSTLW